jgi:hypothetical protein
MLFYRLLQQAVVTEPVTCDNVVRPLPQAGEIEVGLLDGYKGYPLSSSQAKITGWISRS